MRALRIVLAAMAVLMALLLAAAWIGPTMLDWGRYRVAIASLASAALGRPVQIAGGVTLRLLPEPTLTAAGISVQDLAGGGGAFSARELRLRVGLGPLLAGRVDARELVLDRPELHLPWPISTGPPTSPGMPVRPAWLVHAAARIEGGTLVVGNVTIADIDATLTTDPDTRALVAAGDARLFGLPWRFTARLGVPGADHVTTLLATLDGEGPVRDTGGRFSGEIAPDGALAGQISGRGPDLALLLPAPAVPWRAEGRLTASGGLAAADELALEIAGSPARGAVALRVSPMPRLDVALTASRLNLDAWLPVLLHGTGGALDTGIDLSAEAATLAGGTVRALRGAFDLGPGGVVVRDAAAILPGEASLRLSGTIPDATAAAAPVPTFKGRAVIDLPDARATLRWLADAHIGLSVGLPADVLRVGTLAATVTLDRQSAILTDLSGSFDGTALTGEARLVFGAHPRLDTSLRLDRLELDSWLPGGSLGIDTGIDTLARLAAGPESAVHLRVGQAVLRGVQADAVTLDAATAGGHLTLRQLAGAVSGLRVALSGDVTSAGRVGDARFDLQADAAAPLGDLLRLAVRDAGGDGQAVPLALFRGPVHVQAQASGPRDALGGAIVIDLADGQAVAQPVVNLTTRGWSATVTLRHPGAPRLLEMLGLRGAAEWLGDGSLSLIGQFSGVPGQVAADQFDLSAGSLRASGQLLLAQGGGDPRLTGRIGAAVLPVPFLREGDAWTTDPLPFRLLRGWRADVRLDAAEVLGDGQPMLTQASAQALLAEGRLRLDHFSGRLDHGSIAGDIAIDAGAEPPGVAIRGKIADASVGDGLLHAPVDLRGGSLDSTFALAASGYSPSALLSTLGGSMQVQITDGHLAGFDAAGALAALAVAPATALAGVRAALATGATAFARLDATVTLAQGVATLGNATMTAPDLAAVLSGSIDLTAPSLDVSARLRPALPGVPEPRLRLIGPLARPAHVVDLSDLALPP